MDIIFFMHIEKKGLSSMEEKRLLLHNCGKKNILH